MQTSAHADQELQTLETSIGSIPLHEYCLRTAGREWRLLHTGALLTYFEINLAPGGRVLIADPFRPTSMRFFEGLESAGWRISVSTWSIGEEQALRTIGVFEMMQEPNR